VVEWRGPLRRADGKGPARFIGAKLEKWMDELANQSAASVANLPAAERQAVRAGRLMAAFSLAVSSGRREEAARIQAELRQSLPDEIFKSLFGPQPPQ